MLDLVIIGAGPCGLSCALAAAEAGLQYTVVDKGNVAEAIRRYPVNMTFFSTSENIEIGNIPLITQGIRPSRSEALKYYQKVAHQANLPVQRFTEVKAVNKQDNRFSIKTNRDELAARYVILATGYYDLPRYLNIPGEDLPHVSHYYTEPYRYSGTRCLVVGGANSAVEAALDLYRHGATVTLVHQFAQIDQNVKYWIKPDLENRIKQGEIKAYFNSHLTRISNDEVQLTTEHEPLTLPADFVFLMTGYRPDADFLRSCGVQLRGEALIPEVNPRTYESSVSNLYLAGSIIGGEETAKIFIENGRHHAQPIIQDILR